MKYSLLVTTFLLTNLVSSNLKVAPITIKNIGYHKPIVIGNFNLVQVNENNIKKYRIRCQEFPDISLMRKGQYRTKHYISKNKIICKKDVYVPVVRKVKFKFGMIEVEREGSIIKETNQYIKIKNLDGSIEKIYKDGRSR